MHYSIIVPGYQIAMFGDQVSETYKEVSGSSSISNENALSRVHTHSVECIPLQGQYSPVLNI